MKAIFHDEFDEAKIVEDFIVLETTVRQEFVIAMSKIIYDEDHNFDMWKVSTISLGREFSIAEGCKFPRIRKSEHVLHWDVYEEAIEDFNARVQYFANVIYKLPQG